MVLLEHGKYYHIYNRGNNRCNLFYTRENYRYFLRLYQKYIDPVAETYAWVLLQNHFHLLVRIKEKSEIDYNQLPIPVKEKFEKAERILKPPHLYFSDLFNAYCQAINKQEGRVGSLFQKSFKRILVDTPEYFTQLVSYIHCNPVHHGFTENYKDYPWSSYGTIISLAPTRLQREKVIGWFNGRGEFINQHTTIQCNDLFLNYLIE
jgi:putative transposase